MKVPFYTKYFFILCGMARITLVATSVLLVTPADAAGPTILPQSDESGPEAIEGYRLDFPALGTRVYLTAYHTDENLVNTSFSDARKLVKQLADILTDYDPNSETRQLSLKALEQPHSVSAELFEILALSDEWHQLTDGAFDSSLGHLTQLWRKHRRAKRIPEPERVQQALARCGWQHVRVDHEKQVVTLGDVSRHTRDAPQTVQLDFGAIGKGYIVDRVFEQLQERGLSSCLVNISGNIRCGKPPPERAGWRIAVAPLEQDGVPLRTIELCETAIATSGDLWQFVEIDGVRRSHILDPRTGFGVIGPISATVIARSATAADAFATAACILPTSRALQIAEMEGMELLVARREDDEPHDGKLPPNCVESPDFPGPAPD